MKKVFIILIFGLSANILIAQNHNPVSVNDTIYTYYGDTVYVNPLANDYDPDGDSLKSSVSNFEKISNVLYKKVVCFPYNADPKDTLRFNYYILDYHGGISAAQIILILNRSFDYANADANNINALISPVGNHFWDYESAHFEVPKGSGNHAVFNSTFWISGLDQTGQMHLAGEMYRRNGFDFSPGPICLVKDSAEIARWLPGTWKLNQSEIDYHRSNWYKPFYKPSRAILEWPANGNTQNGNMPVYAPFFDRNKNGVYQPLSGDYPIIRGDQSIFFVVNDSVQPHTESKGRILGIEILGTVYEYNSPSDPVLDNTLFLHYDIVNRSRNDYNNMYLGIFSDFDLGDFTDDFLGTDVSHGMVYVYNGNPEDGNGQPGTYGTKPPAIGMKIIAGPYLQADGIDNLLGQCNYDINGLGFGDNIVDNERIGMTNSMYFSNIDPNPVRTDPKISIEYYNYMQSKFKDNTHLLFGKNGHYSSGAEGPDCNFYMPGYTDTLCNWGTAGTVPNGGYNQNGYFWNEETSGNPPGDRRILGSIGPFSMRAGESIPLDFCYIFVQSDKGAIASRDSLIRAAGHIQDKQHEILSHYGQTYGKPEISLYSNFRVFPNPAHDLLFIDYQGKKNQGYTLISLAGSHIKSGSLVPGTNSIDLSGLAPGMYLIKSGPYCSKVTVK